MHFKTLLFASLVFLLTACSEKNEPPRFALLPATSTGLHVNNQLTEDEDFNIIEYLYFYNGAGVGAGDLNGDGLPDLVFNRNQQHPVLYLNKSETSIQFEDYSDALQFDTISGWGTGVAMADVNGDGWLDIYLTQVGNYKKFEGHNRLLIHQGLKDGLPSFEDQTEQYGLDFSGLSTQAAFFDYDLDGDLDMYLLNHSTHQTSNYGRASLRLERDSLNGDRLYRNDGGQFTDVTNTSGIYGSKIGYGLGIAISDLDNNGFPDIYVGNDFHENDYLYRNKGGRFRESIKETISRTSQFSMGVDIADVNNDGYTDILTLDMMPEDLNIRKRSVSYDPYTIFLFKKSYGYHDQFPHNHLQINAGSDELRFAELAAFAGIESTDWSWSCLWQDFNNDGQKDLFVSNGILRRPNDLDYLNYIANPIVQEKDSDLQLAAQMPSGKVSNYLFFNEGQLQFSKQEGGPASLSSGAVYADFDNDGDLDLVVSNINEAAFCYENQTVQNADNNYLKIALKGAAANPFGIGAKVTLSLNEEKTITLENYSQRGFMSSVPPVLFSGLGQQTTVQQIEVTWPSGKSQIIRNVPANQTLTLEENNAQSKQRTAAANKLFTKANPLFQFTHQENRYNDIEREKLQPQLYSREGPALAVGDVNGDQQMDIFIGGAKAQAPALFVSQQGAYVAVDSSFWQGERAYEDTDASFFDADGDGDLDLYVCSGGNEHRSEHPALLDRLYLNDGMGQYTRQQSVAGVLLTENSSCVNASDFDADGDVDLFVGTRVDRNHYARNPVSYLLENKGNGQFTAKATPLGMVTDAAWGDVDADGRSDLIVVGDWMPVTILLNTATGFRKKELPQTNGWWRSVQLKDMDADGRLDIIAGNFGLNADYAPDADRPLLLKTDATGQQAFMTYENGTAMASADELVKQMPILKKEFATYQEYASLDANAFFPNTEFDIKEVHTFQSTIFYNEGAVQFQAKPLPRLAQISSVNAILVEDFDRDGRSDLLLAGNEWHLNTRLGKKDAAQGLVLLQKEERQFDLLSNEGSGLTLQGMIRAAAPLSLGESQYYLFSTNDAPL
ncbi:MAG: VCBS repeat-containing protein, partial [Bacteroidota bacterium]